MTYRNRYAAGTALAECLARHADPDTVVLGLVRGGVPVAAAVADRLGCPLDALVVRKLGVPWAPEVAFGAVGPGGVQVFNHGVADRLDPVAVRAVIARERAELDRRERRYRRDHSPIDLARRIVILVDDGLATGASACAAVTVLRRMETSKIIMAAPVGSAAAVKRLRHRADDVICPLTPARFGAVSRFYDDFGQVTDDEVVELLNTAQRH